MAKIAIITGASQGMAAVLRCILRGQDMILVFLIVLHRSRQKALPH